MRRELRLARNHKPTERGVIMSKFFQSVRKVASIVALAGAVLAAQTSVAQPAQSVGSMRSSYSALLDGYDQVFRQEGNARGLRSVLKARAAMSNLPDRDIATVFARSSLPDMTSATVAIQRLAATSQKNIQSIEALKSAGFPSAPSLISACSSVSYGDQSVYDALIAFQVTSAILSAATFACVETILGENGSLVCEPFSIANDIASGIYAVRSFCGSADTSATVTGTYDRLGHIHTDLTNARADIITNNNTNTATLTSNISAGTTAVNNNVTASTTAINANVTSSKTAIINNDNANNASVLATLAANTTTIVNTSNSNTTAIISNANSNRDILVTQLHQLGCEIIRLLNTPDGQRASSILACKAEPGYPYSWNKK